MKKLITLFIASLFAFSCSQGVVDESKDKSAAVEKSESSAQQGGVQSGQTDPHAGVDMSQGQAPVKKERVVKVPKEVSDKYKSLIIEVKNLQENTTVQADILIGQKTEVTGTPFKVELEYYLPDFVIETDGSITTRGVEEKNPVAKIKVFKFDEVYFDGWLFKNHPDEHGSFKDNVYSISIVKSLTK